MKVEIGLEPADEDEPLNCILPVSCFFNTILSSGISAKPCTALITKIDPSKPLGKLTMSVATKSLRSNLGGNYAMAAGMGGEVGMRLDPSYTNTYRQCVADIKSNGGSMNTGSVRATRSDGVSVNFYVSQRDGDISDNMNVTEAGR